jgi:hypothetical protein
MLADICNVSRPSGYGCDSRSPNLPATFAATPQSDAGSATSHETLFTAWEIDCEHGGKDCDPRGNFVVWDDFLKAIKISNKLEVTTLVDVYSGGTVSAGCEIKLRDWEIAFLEREQWIAAICSKPDANARPQRRSISQPASSTPSK